MPLHNSTWSAWLFVIIRAPRATQSCQFGNTAPQNSACPANTFSDPLRQLPHALLQNSTNGNYYCYNNVGNMVQRKEGWDAATGQYQNTTNYVYDNENRLVQVKRNSTTLVNYRYDGDGRRVQEWTQTTGYNSTTTNYVNYIGAHAEVTAVRYQYGMGTPTFSYGLTKYYSAGAQRVAVRSNNNAPQYLLGDHLGSMSMSLNSNATVASEVRYKPFGYRRWASGTVPTHYQFTGQVFDQNTGLYFYNARFYDHSLGRFIQADTIVPEPGNPQALNRYSYVYNNPLKYTDPTGPCPTPPAGSGRVICVDLFIQVPLIADGDGHGDGLGFDPNSDSDKSTAWLYIYLAEDGKLIDTHYHLGVSETELGPYSPYYDEEYN